MSTTTFTATRHTALAGALAALALTIAACGGYGSPEGDGGATTGTAVTVTATEYTLKLASEGLKPGTYTFVLDNAGKAPHALTIKGPGVESKSSETVQGGGTTQLTVTLRAGTYELWCPVGDHRGLGMQRGLTVG